LGGLGPQQAEQAWEHGAQGVAEIHWEAAAKPD
ncbi:hypothetical protein, partial [Pseudomonas aeruginosa]